MNDDPTPASSGARLPTHDDNDSDARSQDGGDAQGPSRPPSDRRHRSHHGRRRSSSRIRRAKAGISKKLEFMTHLMSSLDVMVFAELCVLYYMDCSFARLVMRSLVQYMYLTPKPEDFVKLMPAPRPQIYTVFATNIICMLLHLLLALPQASETMRGYLHGGVIIDFVGQKAPTSRIGLLLLDCLVLLLQCVMCAVWLEKDRLKKIEVTLRSIAAGGVPKTSANTLPDPVVLSAAADSASTQDLDAEERGVLRDDPLGEDESRDIELQPLMTRGSPPAAAESSSSSTGQLEARYQRILTSLGGSDPREGAGRPSLLDVLMSGNGLLANFHVAYSLRTFAAESSNTSHVAGYPLRLTGYTGTTLAALAAESQARLERRTRQR